MSDNEIGALILGFIGGFYFCMGMVELMWWLGQRRARKFIESLKR